MTFQCKFIRIPAVVTLGKAYGGGEMLHMLVAKHGPETCAAVVPELRDKALAALNERDKIAKKLGITIEGGWTDMPGHTIYMVIDAPNAHVVQQLSMEMQLMEWNTVSVNPVVTLVETKKVLEQKKR